MDLTFFVIIIGLIYFVPWIVAYGREHRDTVPIFILDLFLGWTLVGWVIALVWACTDRTRQPSRPTRS